MSEAVIQADHVTFRYHPQLPDVLHDVSLTVNRGDFVAMLGQNGAGKTTLAKHFNGLLLPTEGDVAVNGASTRGQKLSQLAHNVGYCYQNPDHQIFSSTVEKEVRFGPENLGLKGAELNNAVDHALELVGLAPHRDEHPFGLGRGQRQLLAVASVLAIGAPVLVVDEPTTGMDHQGATAIMRLLAQWNADGRTIVVITHDMDVVAEYVPRSVVMAHGDIIANGPTLDVLSDHDVLAEARLEAPPPVWMSERLSGAGIPICGTIERLANEISDRMEVDRAGRVQRLP